MIGVTMPVQHNAAQHRFEVCVDDVLCVCDYRLHDGVATFTHTGVPQAVGGRGIAAALVGSALAWARDEGLKVRPACSYVATYLRRHPEFQDLLAQGFHNP